MDDQRAYGLWEVSAERFGSVEVPKGVTVESFHMAKDPRHVRVLVSSKESNPELGIYFISRGASIPLRRID